MVLPLISSCCPSPDIEVFHNLVLLDGIDSNSPDLVNYHRQKKRVSQSSLLAIRLVVEVNNELLLDRIS